MEAEALVKWKHRRGTEMNRMNRKQRLRRARLARTVLGCALLMSGGALLGTVLAAAAYVFS